MIEERFLASRVMGLPRLALSDPARAVLACFIGQPTRTVLEIERALCPGPDSARVWSFSAVLVAIDQLLEAKVLELAPRVPDEGTTYALNPACPFVLPPALVERAECRHAPHECMHVRVPGRASEILLCRGCGRVKHAASPWREPDEMEHRAILGAINGGPNVERTASPAMLAVLDAAKDAWSVPMIAVELGHRFPERFTYQEIKEAVERLVDAGAVECGRLKDGSRIYRRKPTEGVIGAGPASPSVDAVIGAGPAAAQAAARKDAWAFIGWEGSDGFAELRCACGAVTALHSVALEDALTCEKCGHAYDFSPRVMLVDARHARRAAVVPEVETPAADGGASVFCFQKGGEASGPPFDPRVVDAVAKAFASVPSPVLACEHPGAMRDAFLRQLQGRWRTTHLCMDCGATRVAPGRFPPFDAAEWGPWRAPRLASEPSIVLEPGQWVTLRGPAKLFGSFDGSEGGAVEFSTPAPIDEPVPCLLCLMEQAAKDSVEQFVGAPDSEGFRAALLCTGASTASAFVSCYSIDAALAADCGQHARTLRQSVREAVERLKGARP